MSNGIIDDPFIRLNERACQWVDKEDWEYKTTFDVTDEIYNRKNIRLIFKGLDTYADVYLNEEKILSADNMYREWDVNCSVKLKKEGNLLRVYFHSPIKTDLSKYDSLPFHYPAIMDQSENGGLFQKQLSIFARKAPYHYGWDWGPRLVTSGIWRPVMIQAWDNARIGDVQIVTSNISKKSADVTANVEIVSSVIGNARVTLTNSGTGEKYKSKAITLTKGINIVSVDFKINEPKLWWSNGLGNPYLYSFKTALETDGVESDNRITKIGIRTLKLVFENPDHTKTFHFELNGVPVFMKGANYIPFDNFVPRITGEKYEEMILNAKNAHFNMLRVWGGGIYENDMFYDLCDKYGILLWHDFMFACSLYPIDGNFRENVRMEAIQNIKRIRNHPSLALWCGNNEMNIGWNKWWGWKEKYEGMGIADKIWGGYQAIFSEILPDLLKEIDPKTPYRESSPIVTDGSGDKHYWDVWHGEAPFSAYEKEVYQFMSEYGFQSFPDFNSVKRFASQPKDWDIYSEVILLHQRNNRGNQLINSYMEKEYNVPKNFENFLYLSQIQQAEAIKTAEEVHRRNMPACMGTLYWQLDDCWPVASWSSVDYYGRWKALHYYTRRAYSTFLVSPNVENKKLKVHVVSDSLSPVHANLTLSVMDFNGNHIFEWSGNVLVSANKSNIMFSDSLENLMKGKAAGNVVLVAELKMGTKLLASNNLYFAKAKDMNFPKTSIQKTIEQVDNGYKVTLITNKFARCVNLQLMGALENFSDNYFDLLPDRSFSVVIKTNLPEKDFREQLKIVSLADIYE